MSHRRAPAHVVAFAAPLDPVSARMLIPLCPLRWLEYEAISLAEEHMSTSQPDRADWVFEPAPCEDCPLIARCRSGQACAAFESFILYGGRRWQAEAREPTID
jgi:hypothetical protein